jgi:hypothetical protein
MRKPQPTLQDLLDQWNAVAEEYATERRRYHERPRRAHVADSAARAFNGAYRVLDVTWALVLDRDPRAAQRLVNEMRQTVARLRRTLDRDTAPLKRPGPAQPYSGENPLRLPKTIEELAERYRRYGRGEIELDADRLTRGRV